MNYRLYIPLGASIGMGANILSKTQDEKKAIVYAGLVFLVVWILTRTIDREVKTALDRPEYVNVSPDVAGQIDQGFDPTKWTDRLKEDIYEVWGARDAELYKSLITMSNASLTKIYNDWNKRYFHKDNESLTTAIAGELTALLSMTAANNMNALVDKLRQIGLN